MTGNFECEIRLVYELTKLTSVVVVDADTYQVVELLEAIDSVAQASANDELFFAVADLIVNIPNPIKKSIEKKVFIFQSTKTIFA